MLFLDADISAKALQEALIAKGVRFEVSAAHFPDETPDPDWIREVARRGWVVLTADARIRYRQEEFLAVKESGCAMFVLCSGNLRGIEIAEIVINALPRIRKLLATEPRPFIARIPKQGPAYVWSRPGDPENSAQDNQEK